VESWPKAKRAKEQRHPAFPEMKVTIGCFHEQPRRERALKTGNARKMFGRMLYCAALAGEMASPQQVTELLLAWSQGQSTALEELMPLVHQELQRLAHHYMAGQRPGHTLQTTALVNEAYLRLVDCSRVRWQNRAHFFAVSARDGAAGSGGGP
jgi:hypothetical protein